MAQNRWSPRVTVATVVPRDGRFLLVEERIGGQLVLNQPAGHLEPGESLVEAAVRETLEETGWLVEPWGILHIALHRVPAADITFHRTCFCARPLRHHPDRPLDPAILSVHWLTETELRARAGQLRSPMVLRGIERFAAAPPHPLDLLEVL